MDPTTLLTGMLPAVVVLASLFTAVASLILLMLYRRSVVRGMRAGMEGGAVPPEPVTAQRAEPPALALEAWEAPSGEAGAAALGRQLKASQRRLALAYLVAGTVYATVMTVPWLVVAGDGFLPLRTLWFLVVFSWPTALTLLTVRAGTRGRAALIVGCYFALLALVAGLALQRSSELTPGQLVYLWCFANLPATLLLVCVLFRPVRAVAPLVLAFMVLGLTGAGLLVALTGGSDAALRVLVEFAAPLGLGAWGVYLSLHLVGFAALGAVGWLLLRRLGGAYQRKRFSAQSVNAGALWLMFAVLQCFTLVFEHWAWILTAPVAFLAFQLAFRMACRVLLPRPAGAPRSLLLLRVFALGKRSRALYDQLVSGWLRIGYVDMIAGPDLATSTVEPHEFLEFVSGRLGRLFVGDQAALERGLKARDREADPDGRYRVNEFFCRDHTWRTAVSALAREDDGVLMDLRSFSAANAGCRWELQELLNVVPLQRVLLLVDESTDIDYLKQTAQELWSSLAVDSPNRGGPGRLRFFRLDRSPVEVAGVLIGALCGLATSTE